jgi:hypothetical protein
MTDELWAPVREFPEHYEISSHGQLRRKKSGKLRKPQAIKGGYVLATMSVNGKIFGRYVHRLVVDAFLGPIALGLEVNHKDGVKTNNGVANLEVVTTSENRIHRYRVLGCKPNRVIGIRHHSAILPWEQIQAIRGSYDGKRGSIGTLARQYGVKDGYIWRIVTKKSRREA